MESKDNDSKELIIYFMGQTNQRLAEIESKLVELIAFRSEVLATAKTTSVLVGVFSGIISVLVGIVLRKVGL